MKTFIMACSRYSKNLDFVGKKRARVWLRMVDAIIKNARYVDTTFQIKCILRKFVRLVRIIDY